MNKYNPATRGRRIMYPSTHTMPYFIQRRDNDRLETVDQFTDSKEAFAAAREYNLSDSFAQYYVTRQPCRGWNDED